MKKTKQQLIEEYKAKPFEAGDPVYVKWVETKVEYKTIGKGKKRTQERHEFDVEKSASGNVLSVDGDNVLVNVNGLYSHLIPQDLILRKEGADNVVMHKSNLHYSLLEIGANPFVDRRYSLDYMQQDISSLLHYMDENGYGGRGGTDFDPFVLDVDGNRCYFQRGYVWTIEQKQALIDSIYNQIDIGKFVLAYYGIDTIEQLYRAGEKHYNVMCIDGKQRMNAILDFVNGKFPDSYGNYWDDLSNRAQSIFESKNVSICMLREREVTPAFIKQIFLGVNFTGTPMSPEHIEYVKSIRV